jgi:hypothetical protein
MRDDALAPDDCDWQREYAGGIHWMRCLTAGKL